MGMPPFERCSALNCGAQKHCTTPVSRGGEFVAGTPFFSLVDKKAWTLFHYHEMLVVWVKIGRCSFAANTKLRSTDVERYTPKFLKSWETQFFQKLVGVVSRRLIPRCNILIASWYKLPILPRSYLE